MNSSPLKGDDYTGRRETVTRNIWPYARYCKTTIVVKYRHKNFTLFEHSLSLPQTHKEKGVLFVTGKLRGIAHYWVLKSFFWKHRPQRNVQTIQFFSSSSRQLVLTRVSRNSDSGCVFHLCWQMPMTDACDSCTDADATPARVWFLFATCWFLTFRNSTICAYRIFASDVVVRGHYK